MTRERCKSCGRFNPLGFHVPNEVWAQAIPEDFQNRVLCIVCFDYFATENGVQWDDCVEFFPVSGTSHQRAIASLATLSNESGTEH